MQIYEINVCQDMIFGPYTVDNKCQILQIGNQTEEKVKILSEMLE